MDAIYFLFDVETTGSKRNWDKIIFMSFMAFDARGNQRGSFSKKVNPAGVLVDTYLTRNVHGKILNESLTHT